MRRTVRLSLLLLAALALGIAWYLRRGSSAPRAGAPRDGAEAASGSGPASAAATRDEGPAPSPSPAPARRAEARVKRDALREQIMQQLARRATPDQAGLGSAAPRAPSDARPPGTLRDRLGGRDALVDHINRDFMPLATECIEEARLRTPRLTGVLGLGLETLSDEELGGVVDVAGPSPTSTIADPLLLECIRESAFSLSLPSALLSGREKFEITIPVEPGPGPEREPEPDAGGPR